MSLIYKRKSTVPNTEPCGTPNVMFNNVELEFLIDTYCLLLQAAETLHKDGGQNISSSLKKRRIHIPNGSTPP